MSVLKNNGDFEAVEADITVRATNLAGQLKDLNLRQIREQNSIYYIADFRVSNEEIFIFDIQVTTPDKQSATIKLQQQYFTN